MHKPSYETRDLVNNCYMLHSNSYIRFLLFRTKCQPQLTRESSQQTQMGSSSHINALWQVWSLGLADFGVHEAVSFSQKLGALQKPLLCDPHHPTAISACFLESGRNLVISEGSYFLSPLIEISQRSRSCWRSSETNFSLQSLHLLRERGLKADTRSRFSKNMFSCSLS